MKYTVATKINARIEKIVHVLEHPEMRIKWFNLSKYKVIKGNEGKAGAKARFWINILGAHEVTETILEVNYPNHFSVLYEMPGGKLRLDGTLEAQGKLHTLYTLEHQFTFNSIFNPMCLLVKSGFKKESEDMMLVFKRNVEAL